MTNVSVFVLVPLFACALSSQSASSKQCVLRTKRRSWASQLCPRPFVSLPPRMKDLTKTSTMLVESSGLNADFDFLPGKLEPPSIA